MAFEAPTRTAFAVTLLWALIPLASAAPAGFCVEDADDALWLDCVRETIGITQRVRVSCRREPGAALIEVHRIAREIPAGSGDCPAPRAARGPGRDGLPRNGGGDGAEEGAAEQPADAAGNGAEDGTSPAVPARPPTSTASPAPEPAHVD